MPPDIPRIDSAATIEDIAASLRQTGAVVIENFLDADVLARMNHELDSVLESTSPDRTFLNPAIEWFFGKRTRHLTAVAGKSRIFGTDVLCHPIYMGLCDAILAPSCATYQLNLAHVLDRGPGAETQMLHRDELVWVHMPRPHPELQVASMLALVDFTEENGATRIVPGSHEWPIEREAREDEVAVAEMSAGSATIYLGSTIHGAGANTTESQWRRGMHTSYVLGWLRTEENHYLGTPIGAVKDLPRRSQELLGYVAHDAIQAGGGYLGAVDLRDPVDLMETGEL